MLREAATEQRVPVSEKLVSNLARLIVIQDE
jgi:hypothetical protein